ncbi:MAG: hypothetical protein Q8S84_07990 [bacterium]|nr:hypothetical protein [bacterium]
MGYLFIYFSIAFHVKLLLQFFTSSTVQATNNSPPLSHQSGQISII